MKKYLVIGGGGYIGSEICNQLELKSCEYAIFDNFQVTAMGNGPNSKNVIVGDIRNVKEIESAIISLRPTHVIHLAAIHYIPQCNKNPQLVYETNVLGLKNIINAIHKLEYSPRFLFTSSAAIYSGKEGCFSEKVEPKPMDVYGQSKYEGELLIRNHLLNYTIARLFNVYGYNDPHEHLIPKVVRSSILHNSIELGASNTIRDYIHISDVSSAIIKLVDSTETIGEIYNVGTGIGHGVKDIVKLALVNRADVDISYNNYAFMRKNDQNNLVADINKILSLRIWKPQVPLESGLKTVA